MTWFRIHLLVILHFSMSNSRFFISGCSLWLFISSLPGNLSFYFKLQDPHVKITASQTTLNYVTSNDFFIKHWVTIHSDSVQKMLQALYTTLPNFLDIQRSVWTVSQSQPICSHALLLYAKVGIIRVYSYSINDYWSGDAGSMEYLLQLQDVASIKSAKAASVLGIEPAYVSYDSVRSIRLPNEWILSLAGIWN